VTQIAKVLQLDEHELLTLAGKPDPIIEEAASKNQRVGKLFRRIAEKASQDPRVIERMRKVLEDNS